MATGIVRLHSKGCPAKTGAAAAAAPAMRVTVEERGASYLQVTTFDAKGTEIGGRRIFPDGGCGTKDLPGD